MINSTFSSSTVDIETRARAALPARKEDSATDDDTYSHYRDRLSWELEYIHNAGLSPYISVVTALVDHARKLGITVGPGQGSAPSSLVLYLPGVTQINPVAHGLTVERWFSNPAIEIDVEWHRRGELLDHLWSEHGMDCTAYNQYVPS